MSFALTGQPAVINLGNGYATTYSFDSRYRVSGITTTNGTSTPQDLDYEYFENGNVKRVLDTVPTPDDDVYYNYDELDRLTEMRKDNPSTGDLLAEYEYEGDSGKIGNLTRKREGADDLDLLYENPEHVHAVTSSDDSTYSYDRNGNMLARDGMESFSFDAENRLISTELISHSFVMRNDYAYDGAGDLVRRKTWSFVYSFVTPVTTTFVDGIYEDRHFACGAPTGTKYYMAFGRIIAQRDGSADPRYILADQLGSSVGAITSSTTIQMKYWPFGATRSGSTLPSTHAYTGQEAQLYSTIGAYHYNARFYSTMLGRFVSADPITRDSLNRFSYVLNNPLIHTRILPVWMRCSFVVLETPANAGAQQKCGGPM